MKPIDIPIFVINGFPERAPNIIKELQDKWGYPSHKIRFIYPPIDSHFRSSHYLPCPTWRDPNEHRLLTQGEMKCSVGHLLAWHEISEDKDIDWAIILEDDAELTPWDQGGFYFDGERHDILYLGHKALEPIQEEKRGQGIVKAPYTYWTVGYALTRTAASSLTNVFNKGQVIPSDEFLPYHFGKNPNVGEKHQQCDPVYLRAFLHNPAIVTPSGKWASGTENSQSAFDLVVLLFSTDDTKIEHLEEYKRLKYETYIVGDKVKDWDTSGPAGFQKIPALHSYISRHFNKRDIARTVFLIADGYDTRPVVTPDVLLKRFAEMGKSVVVSGEVNCWPDKRMAESFPKAQETRIYPYPCSGLYMGHGKDILGLLQGMMNSGEHVDDQLALQKTILTGLPVARIDNEAYLFQSMSYAEEHLVRRKGFPYNTRTKCHPAILHANNSTDMAPITPMYYEEPKLHENAFEWIETAPGILQMPFLHEETVTYLLGAGGQHENLWAPLPGDNVPGDELRLRIVDEELWEWFQQTLLEKLGPIINERWRPAKWTSLKDLFMIRYSKEKQPDLHLHNDLSFFSCSIKLRTACQGGYLNFPRQNFNDCFVGNGDLLVWPAKITHPHMVMPTTKGTRVSLVVWTND